MYRPNRTRRLVALFLVMTLLVAGSSALYFWKVFEVNKYKEVVNSTEL